MPAVFLLVVCNFKGFPALKEAQTGIQLALWAPSLDALLIFNVAWLPGGQTSKRSVFFCCHVSIPVSFHLQQDSGYVWGQLFLLQLSLNNSLLDRISDSQGHLCWGVSLIVRTELDQLLASVREKMQSLPLRGSILSVCLIHVEYSKSILSVATMESMAGGGSWDLWLDETSYFNTFSSQLTSS